MDEKTGACGADRGAGWQGTLCRRRRARHPVGARSEGRGYRHAFAARRCDGPADGSVGQGRSHRHRAWHCHRRPAGRTDRDHHPSPRRLHRRTAGDRGVQRRLEGRCGPPGFHDQCAFGRSCDVGSFRLFRRPGRFKESPHPLHRFGPGTDRRRLSADHALLPFSRALWPGKGR